MPGDIERVTFRPDLTFANVELQQGRLLLAADWDEQSASLAPVADPKSGIWQEPDHACRPFRSA